MSLGARGEKTLAQCIVSGLVLVLIWFSPDLVLGLVIVQSLVLDLVLPCLILGLIMV